MGFSPQAQLQLKVLLESSKAAHPLFIFSFLSFQQSSFLFCLFLLSLIVNYSSALVEDY